MFNIRTPQYTNRNVLILAIYPLNRCFDSYNNLSKYTKTKQLH